MTLTSLGAVSEQICSKTSGARSVGLMQLHTQAAIQQIGQFGHPKCPCVGLTNISGTTDVVQGATKAQYPADVGSHCAAWDYAYEPCEKGADCEKQWCFVDPCNCDLDFMPKSSVYLPDGRYHGKPMYYSYHTCKRKQTWGQEHDVKKTLDKSMCDTSIHVSAEREGKADCRCVGIDGLTGTINVTVWDQQVPFPADTGASCKVWDLESNPLCTGSDAELPDWCTKKWCFVDPCSCSLAVPPARSKYLPYASIGGKSIFYSYETCNDPDLWTPQHSVHACVNQKTENACLSFDKCAWDLTKQQCLAREPLHECNVAKARVAMEIAEDAAHLDAEAMRNMTLARGKAEAADKAMHKAAKGAEHSKAIRHAAEANASKGTLAAAKAVEQFKEAEASAKHTATVAANKAKAAKLAERKEASAHAAASARKSAAAKADEKLKEAKATAEAAWEAEEEKKAAANRSMQAAAKAMAAERAAQAAAAEQQVKEVKAAVDLEAAKALERAAAAYAAEKAAAAAAAKKEAEEAAVHRHVFREYGKSECPCIGVDGRTGTTAVVLNETTKTDYPADVGSHCAAWDDGLGLAERWCFVDACNCNLHVKPQVSNYLPDGQYQGKPMYYSYDTCQGQGKPSIITEHEVKAETEVNTTMCEKKVDPADWGKEECKCIGIDGLTGTTNFTLGSKQVSFPAAAGGKCGAWDLESNRMCSKGNKEVPTWCIRRWCFVDPCSCTLASPPSRSKYIPHASVDGKTVYYSYDTCSDDGLWNTENNKDACVNQKTEKHCAKLKCGWDTTTKTCLDKDLLSDCKHPKIANAAKIAPEANTSASRVNRSDGEKSFAATLMPAVTLTLMAVSHLFH